MTCLPPCLRSPIIFSYKSRWMAHWFYPAALSVGRGAGATVIAFNIINIISHIIWAETAGIRKRGRGGWSCHHPGSSADSLVYRHMQTHTHLCRQPNNLFSSDNSNFPCHTWRAKSPNLLHSSWLASFFCVNFSVGSFSQTDHHGRVKFFSCTGLNCIIIEFKMA